MTETDNKTPISHASTGTWNLPGDQFSAAVKQYEDKTADLLRWFYQWAQNTGLSMAEAADRVGVDNSTLSRVLRAEYRNPQKQLLNPPPKMLSRMRVIREAERERVMAGNKGRVITPTVDKIHTVCRKVWSQRTLGYIFGEPHIGKSEALKWFRDENNHGLCVYVDLNGVSGVQDLFAEFARALKLGYSKPTKLKERIYRTLDQTNLVIIDEWHQVTYAYRKGSSAAMVHAVKSIHDRCGCGMVICATDIGRREMLEGHDSALCKQMVRRGIVTCQLPSVLPVGDVRAVCETYGLSVPKARKWKELPDDGHLGVVKDIAYRHGILRLFLTLKDGTILASKAGRELRWEDVVKANNIYANLETPEEV